MRLTIKVLVLALAGVAVLAIGAAPGFANCSVGQDYTSAQLGGGSFVNCGDLASVRAYAWRHRQGVQGTVSGGLDNNTTAGGIDSGFRSSLADTGLFSESFVVPGGVVITYNTGNAGGDGCANGTTAREPDAVSSPPCGTNSSTSLPVHNFVLAGVDPSNSFHAVGAAISVDGNEAIVAWFGDQAGAPTVDGDPCGGDAFSVNSSDISCGAIPAPAVTGLVGCDIDGCTLNVAVGPHGIPILDDCDVAYSKTINCPRNLDGGRALFYKRGSCSAPPTDLRTFTYTEVPLSGAENFRPFGEDRNLNGVLDSGEDTIVANGRRDPIVLPGNLVASTPVFIPKLAGATDCVYLGAAVRLDPTPLTSPNANAQPVYTPLVSMSPVPISLDTATPVSDRVLDLRASKSKGNANVSWLTSAEFTISGFKLVGQRSNGSSVDLSGLIAPKQGNTGGSASYSIDLKMGDLKGAGKVSVVVIHADGHQTTFGPVSFE
jgi:hypothetical protein